MDISIVIPARNAAPYLSHTIESVLTQTVSGWELIIVDDGSTDSTASIASSYARHDERIRIVKQFNAGIADARNRGFAESDPSSRYVIFLDADDLWERDALETLMDMLRQRPEAVGAHGLSRLIDSHAVPCAPGALETWGRDRMGVVDNTLIQWPVYQATSLAVLAYRNCIYTPGQALLRRSALETVGLLDSMTTVCNDWDMWLRLSEHGDIAFTDKVVLNYRWHESNMSHNRQGMVDGQRYVRRKMLTNDTLTTVQRRTVILANLFWCCKRSTVVTRSDMTSQHTPFDHILVEP